MSQPLQSALAETIVRLLAEEPVEPGHMHPIETLLAQARWPETGQLLAAVYADTPDLRRSLLLAQGRLPASLFGSTTELRSLLATALRDKSLQIREAAVRAAETLGSSAKVLLPEHDEAVPWLRDYIRRVVAETGTA